MNITDPRLLDENGALLIPKGLMVIDVGGGYEIDYSRLATDHPNQLWLYFILDDETRYSLEGDTYYKMSNYDANRSDHITKEQFITEIQESHQPLFDWILWNELP